MRQYEIREKSRETAVLLHRHSRVISRQKPQQLTIDDLFNSEIRQRCREWLREKGPKPC